MFSYGENLELDVRFFPTVCQYIVHPNTFFLWHEYFKNMTKLLSQLSRTVILAFSVSGQSWRNVNGASMGLWMFWAVLKNCVFFWFFSRLFDPWNQPTNWILDHLVIYCPQIRCSITPKPRFQTVTHPGIFSFFSKWVNHINSFTTSVLSRQVNHNFWKTCIPKPINLLTTSNSSNGKLLSRKTVNYAWTLLYLMV